MNDIGPPDVHVPTRRALITGVSGQTGSYLAELLLAKGYEVHGIVRRSSSFNTGRIDHIFDRLTLHFADMADTTSLRAVLDEAQPDEVYNLAAQSHVRVSFDVPEYTADVTALGALRMLEAIRRSGSKARFYQASSSEMFGNAPAPQSESTPFQPASPYACAKTFAHYATVNYREAYGMFAVCGILHNHESPRRGETFVTRKITRALGRIKHGLQKTLMLGNLNAERDWGHARDYARGIWMMMQAPEPRDYVLATGTAYDVRHFLDVAASYAGVDWERHVKIDPRLMRPREVHSLRGDATLAHDKLGWQPETSTVELIREMVDADLRLAEKEAKT
jgi:GDPmannose 4,6-dehydratase